MERVFPDIENRKYIAIRIDKDFGIPGVELIKLLREVHRKGKCFRFTATGHSMYPTIRNKDRITVCPYKNRLPYVGEIIAFQNPASGSLVVHRIHEIKNNGLITKGDNQKEVDTTISSHQIIGVITKIERNQRIILWPNRFKNPKFTRVFILINHCTLGIRKIFWSFLIQFYRLYRKDSA